MHISDSDTVPFFRLLGVQTAISLQEVLQTIVWLGNKFNGWLLYKKRWLTVCFAEIEPSCSVSGRFLWVRSSSEILEGIFHQSFRAKNFHPILHFFHESCFYVKLIFISFVDEHT